MTPDPYVNPSGAVPLPPAPQQAAQQPVPQPVQQVQPPEQPLPNMKPAGPLPPPAQMNQSQSIKELKKAVGGAHEILLSATTVFPFTLFPDIITLDREKLTFSNRFFFRIAEVTSIRIEDILNIIADVGPFFGSLKVSTRFFDDSEPHTVNYLWRHDALRFKRVVQGYIISRQKGIDCSSFSPRQLVDMLDKIGQAGPGEDS
ncbi:MAG TPA: hypothetical protein VGO07_02380 [Candidatus Saccharimonadales bacterium]|jgi:hypothetical protein|nr:hypothetical protein [Candidatus Saccharimonadales bacterium]